MLDKLKDKAAYIRGLSVSVLSDQSMHHALAEVAATLEEAYDEIERLRADLSHVVTKEAHIAIVESAVAAERKRCAKIAEDRYWSSALSPNQVARAIAAAIRSKP